VASALVIGALALADFSGCRQKPKAPPAYVVVMYEGMAPEWSPAGSQTPRAEKALLTANVAADGWFHAAANDVLFIGRLMTLADDGKAELRIEFSRRYSTSCLPVDAIVRINEAAASTGCGFSSIIFSYYFRVRQL
jgi:hypothetical protein